MIKYGGPGKLKQACIQRRCSNPDSGNTSSVEIEEPPKAITNLVPVDMDSSSNSSLIIDENPGVNSEMDCSPKKDQNKRKRLTSDQEPQNSPPKKSRISNSSSSSSSSLVIDESRQKMLKNASIKDRLRQNPSPSKRYIEKDESSIVKRSHKVSNSADFTRSGMRYPDQIEMVRKKIIKSFKIPKCTKPKDGPSDHQVPKIAKKIEEKRSVNTLDEPEVSDDEVDFYNDETFSEDEHTDKPSEVCKEIVTPDADAIARSPRPSTCPQASSSSIDQNTNSDTVVASKEPPPERDPKHYIDNNGM